MKIIFVGGGTGGHVQPNLAIIDDLTKILKKRGISPDLLYIGRFKGIEKELVGNLGIRYKGIFTGKLRRYWSWRNISDVFLVGLGFIQSLFILLFNRPKLVFAKGGFVTVPFCLACALLRVPFILHESDTVLGLSNKILLPFAKKIYLGFPSEVYGSRVTIKKALFTGNAVRREVTDAQRDKDGFYKKYGLNEKKKVIFVFGGSQGAGGINRLINELIPTLVKKYVLIHATGRAHENYFKEGFLDLDEKDRSDYLVFGHVAGELGEFLANADLIISRAGANSIAEIISLKKVSIIIPYPLSSADHQKRNAAYLQKNGIASVLDEKLLNVSNLEEEIDFLISDKKVRNSMVRSMENIFPENSSRIIAQDILDLVADQNNDNNPI